MKKLYCLILILVLTLSCSSKMIDKTPNYQLKGAEAQKEYEKFRMGSLRGYRGFIDSEGGFTSFSTKEKKKEIEAVSPKAFEMSVENRVYDHIGWGVFAFTLASIFAFENETPYWVGLAGLFGTSIYIDYKGSQVAEQYNLDLKQKFSPTLSYKYSF